MKKNELLLFSDEQLASCKLVGQRLSRLRKARQTLQSEAALRAGLSRATAVRLEAGDPGRTLGQILRYLEAIAPGSSLQQLINASDPSLITLEQAEQTQRVRLSSAQLKALDF